jgi:hypothetical protein
MFLKSLTFPKFTKGIGQGFKCSCISGSGINLHPIVLLTLVSFSMSVIKPWYNDFFRINQKLKEKEKRERELQV